MVQKYNDVAGSTGCASCAWPATTLHTGSTECSYTSINYDINQLYIAASCLVTFYAICLSVSKVRSPALLAFTVFPAMDVISDILYLLQTTFKNKLLFGACILFIILPNFMFMRKMYEIGALIPRFLITLPAFFYNGAFIWLGTKEGFPVYRYSNNPIGWIIKFKEHDSLMVCKVITTSLL